MRPGSPPADLRILTATLLSLMFGWGLAISLGATVIASDLKAGRLGFFFSHPVRGSSLWASKMTAALALALACAALVLLPTTLFEPHRGGIEMGRLVLLLPFPVLLVVGHLAAVSWHGRNHWLAVDIGAWTLSIFTAVAAARRLDQAGAAFLGQLAIEMALGLTLLGIAIVTCLQVARGRASLARANRILSLGTATVLALVAGGLWLAAGWTLAPQRADLIGVSEARPFGDWIEAEGVFRLRPGYHPPVLIHRHADTMVLLRRYPEPALRPWLTAGNEAGLVWLESGRAEEARGLWHLDLQQSRPRPFETGAETPGRPFLVTLSPSGARTAVLSANPTHPSQLYLTVHELPSGRVLAAERVLAGAEDKRGTRSPIVAEGTLICFDQEDRVVLVTPIWHDGEYEVARLELDVPSGLSGPPSVVPNLRLSDPSYAWVSADGGLVRSGGAVHSTRTGDKVASFEWSTSIGLLDDGRVVSASRTEGRDGWLLSRPTAETARLVVPGRGSFSMLGELGDGTLLVST
jgi:hypothetical protein